MSYLNVSPPSKPKPGDYTVIRGADTVAERNDARTVLRQQGCKSVRFEPLTDGRIVVHGYLAMLAGAEPA
jgi:hypothetical protein